MRKLNMSIGLPLAIILMGIGAVKADTISFQVPACQSDDLLDEFTRYIIDSDTQGMMQLLNYGECTILVEGNNVSVISRGLSTSTIRIDGVKYYLASEAIEKNSSKKSSSPPNIEKTIPQQNQSQKKDEIPTKSSNEIGKYRVQAAQCLTEDCANRAATQLQQLGHAPLIRSLDAKSGKIYRVFTEALQEKEQAIKVKKQIDQLLKVNSLILPIVN